MINTAVRLAFLFKTTAIRDMGIIWYHAHHINPTTLSLLTKTSNHKKLQTFTGWTGGGSKWLEW